MTVTGKVDELEDTLRKLEELHEREAGLLRAMNREALDAVTDEKERLCQLLKQLSAQTPLGPQHRASLDRLRQQATLNQLLVVHARDAVRSILSQASGTSIEVMPGARRARLSEGLRVDVRG